MQTAADFVSVYAAALREHAAGHGERAVALYREALAIAPDHADANANLGTALLTLERPGEAVACYRAALDADPFMDSVRGPLGMALSVLGEHEAACAELELALAAEPENADLHYYLAESLLALGRPAEAADRFLTVLAAQPGHAPAAGKLGVALRSAGRPHESLRALQRALLLAPGDFELRFHLGASLLDLERNREALQTLEQLAGESDEVAVLNNLALAQSRSGELRAAAATIRRVLERHPDYANGWNTLGTMHFQLGEAQEAMAAFARAAACAPDEPDGYVNLSGCLLQRGDRAAALSHVRRAAEICGPHPGKLLVIADQFATLDELPTALDLYRRVLELDAQDAKAASRLLHLTLAACDWSDYGGLVARTLAQVREAIAAGRRLPYVIFNLLALPVTHDFVHAAARHEAAVVQRETAAQEPDAAPLAHAVRRRERIRIGYLLPYTYFHSMPLVLQEIARGHDRGRFEVYGYSITPDANTTFDREFRSAFDCFRELAGLSRHAAARTIHADGIDILVDTTGHTPISCLPVMSLRPAPVQAHAIGFGLSTGADYIDYLVTDWTFMPPSEARFRREAAVYMPDCFLPAFAPPQTGEATARASWSLPEKAVVFANFNEPVKFEPQLFALWMRILKGAPEAVLWLGRWYRETETSLRREAERHGVAPDRVLFAPVVKHHLHARRLPLADVALDNLTHGGGVTTIDALSCGVPLVTLRGATPQTRLGATLCQAAGFPELVVDSLEEYERLAVALAHDSVRRTELRARLSASRQSAALFDIGRYRRHLEAAFQIMWRRRLSGEPATDFDVPAEP